MATVIPNKPGGRVYAIVLRSADFSVGNVAARGALGGEDSVPLPTIPNKCVCCNADSPGQMQKVELVDPGGHFNADPIDVPVCAACTGHAVGKAGSESLAAILLLTSLALAALGFVYWKLPLAGGAGVLGAALAALWLFSTRAALKRDSGGGHHPGLQILVAPRQLVFRTSNRQLVESIVAESGSLVHAVR